MDPRMHYEVGQSIGRAQYAEGFDRDEATVDDVCALVAELIDDGVDEDFDLTFDEVCAVAVGYIAGYEAAQAEDENRRATTPPTISDALEAQLREQEGR